MSDERDGCPDCGDIDHHGCRPAMTDPRWTIEETSGGHQFRLAYNKRRAPVVGAPWCDDLIIRHFENVPQHTRLSPPAFDALVAAVRDADTLHQARQLAARIRRFQRTGHGVDAANAVDDLIDLLAPPAPDTGDRP